MNFMGRKAQRKLMANDPNSASEREYAIDLNRSNLDGGFDSSTLFNDYSADQIAQSRMPAPTRLDEAYRHAFQLLDQPEPTTTRHEAPVSDSVLRRALAVSDLLGVAAAFVLTAAVSSTIHLDITTVAIMILVV